jgi:probable HAF family extracellular repeat protein
MLFPGLIAALTLTLAACGGGGGGGGGGGVPANTAQVAGGGSTFSAAVALNGGTATEVTAVGMRDDAAGVLQPVAWTLPGTFTPGSSVGTAAPLTMPADAGPYGAGYGVNDAGLIVGEVETAPAGPLQAVVWNTPTTPTLLNQGGATSSSAYGINEVGRIVGETVTAGKVSAVTWADAQAGTAPTPLPGADTALASSAYFINDDGEIVGELTDATGTHAAVWRPNTTGFDAPILLDPPTGLTGDSVAMAINDNGVIVGEITAADGTVHAARWTPAGATGFTAADLGVNSSASGINGGGRVVGTSNGVASAWAAGGVNPATMNAALGASQAFAINIAGRAVCVAGGQAFVAVP